MLKEKAQDKMQNERRYFGGELVESGERIVTKRERQRKREGWEKREREWVCVG